MAAFTVTYTSWSLGTGYTITSSNYTYGDNVIISALSGTVVITDNTIPGVIGTANEVTPRVVSHYASSSYSFKVFKNTYANSIYSNNFSIQSNNAVTTINNQTSLQSLTTGDKVYFELTRQDMDFSASGASNNSDLLKVYRTLYGQAYLANTNTFTSVVTSSATNSFILSLSNNTICLTSSLVSIYSSSTAMFIPTSSISYGTFGDVYNSFNVNPFDVLVTKNVDGIKVYNILSASVGPTNLCFTVSPSFGSETIGNLYYVLLLKRNPDETNTIINYTKTAGNTSYGFIIPNNLHPDVLNNIDIITKEVKTKLIGNNAI